MMKKKIKIFLILILILLIIFISIFLIKKNNILNINDNNSNNILIKELDNKLRIAIQKNESLNGKIILSFSVNIGTKNDENIIGITHILEHLFFNGSINYSKKKFNKLFNIYNGIFNAETDDTVTNYYFIFDQEGLIDIIKLLVDSINNWLFKTEEIKKEILNVNSELKMRENMNIFNYLFKILKATVNKNSSFLKDGYRIYKTSLNNIVKIRSKLFDFHKKYYISKLITFSILSEMNEEEVLNRIEKYLEKIKNSNTIIPKYKNDNLFQKENYNNLYFFKSKNNKIDNLNIIFTLDSRDLDSDTLNLFIHLWKYKGYNTLYYYLKIKYNLIINIDTNIIYENENTINFMINFKLTKKGWNNVNNIIKMTLKYIKFIGKENLFYYLENFKKFSIINYVLNLNLNIFSFYNKNDDLVSNVKHIANRLHYTLKLNNLLKKDEYIKDISLFNIKKLCDSFDINKTVYYLESENFKINLKKRNLSNNWNKINNIILNKNINNILFYSYIKLKKNNKNNINLNFQLPNNLQIEEINIEKCNSLKYYNIKNSNIEKSNISFGNCLNKTPITNLKEVALNEYINLKNLVIFYKKFNISLNSLSTWYIEFPKIFLKLKKFEKIYYFNLMKRFFCKYIRHYINTFYYNYIINGFGINCFNKDYYLVIVFKGIYSNLSPKIEQIFNYLNNFKINKEIFNHCKMLLENKYIRKLNVNNLKLSHLKFIKINKKIDYKNIEDVIYFIKNIKEKDLKDFIFKLKYYSKVYSFNIGNYKNIENEIISNIYYGFFKNKEDNGEISIKSLNFNLNDKEYIMYRYFSKNNDDTNNNYETCYLLNYLSKEELIYLKIIKNYLKSKAYNKFREELNFGYVVEIKIRKINFQYFICLIINGSNFNPIKIEPLVEIFLREQFFRILTFNHQIWNNILRSKVINKDEDYDLNYINNYFINKHILSKHFGEDLENIRLELIISSKRFFNFFKTKFISNYKRITIEIFNRNLKLKNKCYKLNTISGLNQNYKLYNKC